VLEKGNLLHKGMLSECRNQFGLLFVGM